MKFTTYLTALLTFAALFITYGLTVPALISAKNTAFVACGAALAALVGPVLGWLWVRHIQIRKKLHQQEGTTAA